MQEKNIDVFMHSSEAMFYTDEIQKQKYPDHLVKKLKNFSMGKIRQKIIWLKKDYKKKNS